VYLYENDTVCVEETGGGLFYEKRLRHCCPGEGVSTRLDGWGIESTLARYWSMGSSAHSLQPLWCTPEVHTSNQRGRRWERDLAVERPGLNNSVRCDGA
jgi:hypothetical protein